MSNTEIRYCDACGTEDVECHYTEGRVEHPGIMGDLWLCDFCYNTHVGNWKRYPSQYPYGAMLADIAKMFNILRKDMRGNE